MFYALMGYAQATIEWRLRAIRNLVSGERGQGTVEYVGLILLVSLLMVGMVAAMKGFNRHHLRARNRARTAWRAGQRRMKATVTIDASSLSEARKKADEAFREFFGESDYTITEESAESYLVDMSGKVLSWRCDFVAEESGAA